MRNFIEHVSVASSSPTRIKCHCFLLAFSFPGNLPFCYLLFLDLPGKTYTSRAEQGQHSWVLIPAVLLNRELQLFWRLPFDLLCLRNTNTAKKTFWLTQLSILSNIWLYTQPTCTHSWLPIQFSCHKESSALKFSFLLELSHSQVEDGLLHLLLEVKRQQWHFNLFTN